MAVYFGIVHVRVRLPCPFRSIAVAVLAVFAPVSPREWFDRRECSRGQPASGGTTRTRFDGVVVVAPAIAAAAVFVALGPFPHYLQREWQQQRWRGHRKR